MKETLVHNLDPFFYDAKISFGIYKNQAINTELKRTLTILNECKWAKLYLNDDLSMLEHSWIIANVSHNGEFYVAKVPKDAIEEVIYAIEPFGSAFAHTSMRFRFNKAIELIARTPTKEQFDNNQTGEFLEQPLLLNDLVLSVEATAPKGIRDFALLASFFYTRGLAFRMLSLTGRGIDKYIHGNASVKQYPLQLSKKQRNLLFQTAIIKGHNSQMKKMYQTLFSNCNWFTFDMLQNSHKFINKQQTILQNTVGLFKLLLNKILIFSKIYPPLAIFGLTWRNIRSGETKDTPNLENDPEFTRLLNLCQMHRQQN